MAGSSAMSDDWEGLVAEKASSGNVGQPPCQTLHNVDVDECLSAPSTPTN